LGLLAANHAIQIAPAPSFGQIGQEDYMNKPAANFDVRVFAPSAPARHCPPNFWSAYD
jgi:hypothetical protein